MDEYKLLGHVRKELDKMREENIAFLAASRADSFDEYKKICGVIRGLSLADSIISDLVQRLDKE